MKFCLKNYMDELTEFEITESQSECIRTIILLTLSGDEVLYIFYNDGSQDIFDSLTSGIRHMETLDDITILSVEQLERLNRK